MPTTLTFRSATIADVRAQRVYWKERWHDPWSLVSPNLWCNSAQWTAQPSNPVAELVWRYGLALAPGMQTFAARFKETNRLRMLVKVEYDVATMAGISDPLRWYGSVEIELDDFHGALMRAVDGDTIAFATGKNFFICYGLENLLESAFVRTSVVAGAQQDVFRVNRGLTFNEGGIGNMSPSPGPDGVYVFHSSVSGGAFWSSQAAVNYLLKYHTPKDFNGQALLPFELGGIQLNAVSVWDEPVLATDGKSVRDLLNVLISRQRLMSWTIRPEETAGGKIVVEPFTMTATDVDLGMGGLNKVPANPSQYRLAFESDRGKEVSLKRSTLDGCDQVVARGARRTSTATFSFYDGTLAKGWSDALETAYEAGASGAADYPAASEVGERQARNHQARSADKFKPVYARFIIPTTFQFKVGDGLSGTVDQPLCPSDADPTIPVKLAPEDVRFIPELALLEGFDYQDLPPTQTQDPPHRQAKPLVLYPRSDSSGAAPRFRQIDVIGITAELPESMEAGDFFSAHVRVETDGSLWIKVQSEPQEFFAAADFTRLSVDPDPALYGSADFRKILATLTVAWSEFVTVAYPATGPVGRDHIREMLLDAGDEFRLDWLCPKTVVAVKPESGELVRCTDGGFIRDDREQLGAVARIAYAWYSQTRRVLTYQTSLLNSALAVGSFITAIGDETLAGDVHAEDVNSVITSIEIKSASAEREGMPRPAIPTLRYETAFGELDAIKFA